MRAEKDSLAAPYQASDEIEYAQLWINEAALAIGTATSAGPKHEELEHHDCGLWGLDLFAGIGR